MSDDEKPAITPWDELGWPKPANNIPPKQSRRDVYVTHALPRLVELVESQIARGLGTKYLVRREANGKFRPIGKDALETAEEGEIIEVWEHPPDQRAIEILLAYLLDKPKEQEQEVDVKAAVKFSWQNGE